MTRQQTLFLLGAALESGEPGPDVAIAPDCQALFGRRAGEADVALPSPWISRHHALVAWKSGDWTITDLQVNGLRVNGQRVASSVLAVGDEVLLPGFGFRVASSAEGREVRYVGRPVPK